MDARSRHGRHFRANPAGVVHLQRNAGVLAVSFNANRKISGVIQVSSGTTSLLTEKGDFEPERLWKKEIRVQANATKCTFELKNNDGVLLLKQSEGEYDWTPESAIKVGPQPSQAIPEQGRRTADDWLQLGKAEELNGNPLAAVQTYQKALLKFPTAFELLKAAGRLDSSLSRFAEALPRLTEVHSRDTTDAEASYYLGIAYEGLEREKEAADAYREATRLPSYRAAAAVRLAEVQAREGALQDAKESLTQSLRSAPEDLRAAEELVAVLRALGRRDEADALANERLAHSSLSDFLHEELQTPNLAHLAADPYRVLNVASEYARLGLYQRALEILSREYPAVDADQTEPGAALPQNHPLVVYFRGYCREKLGQSAADDFSRASRLSTAYIFPSTLEDQRALQAAIRLNDKDATAHYLLGTWHFARSQTDAALSEWQRARQLNPKIPVLQASIGLALLHVKREFANALNAFQEGIANDPANVVNYSGAVSAMTLLGNSATQRVQTLERYPDPGHMPTALVYELALNRAEQGNYRGALELFRNRFFGREEGGTNVRQVWIEVNLQQAVALARAGRRMEALSVARSLGSPVPGLTFTQDGLPPILKSARINYLLGELFQACAQNEDAQRAYRLSAQSTGPSEIVWAWASARKLNGYDAAQWRARLMAALSRLQSNAPTSSGQGWSLYSLGLLQVALGREQQGKLSLREALLAPDVRMSYHLSRLALQGATPR